MTKSLIAHQMSRTAMYSRNLRSKNAIVDAVFVVVAIISFTVVIIVTTTTTNVIVIIINVSDIVIIVT